ncbi:MAG: antitoxin family protein [Phycisphaeraceae bacterium]|nr:antitoxin family protein [Phycisphaeraceae bacterium]
MTQVTEAIFANGVLKPEGKLTLREHERVRVIVESLDQPDEAGRAEALREFREGVARMKFTSNGGGYPSRDELHERR